MAKANNSAAIEGWLQQLRAGDDRARQELLNCALNRLTHLTRTMLKGFGRVRRWEQTDDVVQNSLLRLHRTLAQVQPADAAEFYRLAALSIRRELLDLAKHYYGPQGLGANHASVETGPDESQTDCGVVDRPAADDDSGRLAAWTVFHAQVERLPDDEKAVFDLLWYHRALSG